MTKVAAAAVQIEADQEAEPVLVKPGAVQIDSEGFVTRHIVIHAPVGAVADDMRNPGVWRLVQGNPSTALRKFDNLTIFASDEGWMMQAMVSVAKMDSSKLVIGKVSTFQTAGEGLFNDGVYRVSFQGLGYVVERIRDNQPMGHAHASEALAIDAIRRLYPQRVA
jgi:hypothetical protein